MKEQQDWLLQCRANVANALKEGAKAEVNYKPYFFDVVWPLWLQERLSHEYPCWSTASRNAMT